MNIFIFNKYIYSFILKDILYILYNYYNDNYIKKTS
jgi:hypothetical protein